MYAISAQESNKRMNYYVPIQHAETPAYDKQLNSVSPHASSSRPRRVTRILGRRYALTTTSYKYLDIGISVGTASCVDIVIGDIHGYHFILPFTTWKTFIQRRSDIEGLLQSTEATTRPLWIQDLTIELITKHGEKMVRLTFMNKYLCMKTSTILFMFNLESCIDHMYYWLCENTHIVDDKYQRFVNVVKHSNITDIYNAAKAIRESDIFDKESLVDCELLAYALNDILYDACNK